MFGWFSNGTPGARRALVPAALGWMLDSFDIMLYAIVLAWQAGSALAPFFVGSLADTHGFSTAFALLSVAFAVGAMTWIWLPETRGRRLT